MTVKVLESHSGSFRMPAPVSMGSVLLDETMQTSAEEASAGGRGQAYVRGIALPYNEPDKRSGLMVVGGELVEYAWTEYDADAFRAQLTGADPLRSVRYTWGHALGGGHASLPIGRVERLTNVVLGEFASGPPSRTALRFEAIITDTGMGADVAKAVLSGEAPEVSTLVQPLSGGMERRQLDNGDEVTVRVVTEAMVHEITHVLWGQFDEARVTEALAYCEGCQRDGDGCAGKQALRMTLHRELYAGAQFSKGNIDKMRERFKSIRSASEAVAAELDELDALLEAGSSAASSSSGLTFPEEVEREVAARLRLEKLTGSE